MSLFDEFEALKHLPHELAAWVKSLIAKVPEETPAVAEPVAAPVEAVPVVETPAAPEG